jgi:hypothetical protein
MSSVHIVEDQIADRELLAQMLKESWKAGKKRPEPTLKEWKYAWDLLKEDDLKAGDVVIADLYPTEYWMVAPPPKPIRQPSLPRDPTNFNSASIDMIERFLRRVPEHGAHLIVITYIPNWIERDLDIPVVAEKMRAILAAEHFEVIEKEDKYKAEDCFKEVVSRVNELLRS